MPNANLGGWHHEDGLSFSRMLVRHLRQDRFSGLLPLRDPAAGPVTFTPYRRVPQLASGDRQRQWAQTTPGEVLTVRTYAARGG